MAARDLARKIKAMSRSRLLFALVFLLAGCVGTPRLPQMPGPRSDESRRPSPAEAARCSADLTLARANYSPLPDRAFEPGCARWNAVSLLAVPSDDRELGVTGLSAVACPMARGFAGWARYGVSRAASQILGSPLIRIETYGSYACRNIDSSDRRSAHATANAIDVAAFVLADGRRLSVLNEWDSADPATRHFFRVVHESACKRFGTVLGPAYNADHRDHFHLEVSGRTFCR